ncbi:hypothetical protein SLA2020_115910 [Shorea laevis]
MVSSFAHFLFFTVLLVFSFQPYSQHPLCQRDERLALLQFKESFVIDKHAFVDDPFAYPKVNLWKSQGMDCCFWEGIWCDHDTGHVIGLDLSSSCLLGSINFNSSLFHLFHLQHLNLAFNNFNYSKIPSTFANLTTLSYLNLSNSFFSGQIPSELSGLTSLSTLDLAPFYNPLVPPKGWLELKRPNLRSLVENLTNLEYLRLTGTEVNSRIPSTLANMSSLRYIRLGDCGLFGEFPMGIFQLPKLQVLVVGHNLGLTGNLPEFQFHKQLMFLAIQNTGFSGKLPASIGMLSSLKVLTASNCNFSGLLPPSLGNLTKLETLTLNNNSFTGTVEIYTFLELKYLKDLLLSQNNFSLLIKTRKSTNTIFAKLKTLGLGNCNLKEFPSFLHDLDQLEILELFSNDISGKIPKWIWKFSKSLLILDLSHNSLTNFEKFSISFPSSTLKFLDLSFNQLKASLLIPPLSINFFSVSTNKFSGHIPSEFCNLTSLHVLDLSHNKLNGMIPPCIGNFSKSLVSLNLQGNNFKGPIPPTWVTRNNLKSLQLGHNNLKGKLPRSLTNCRMLEFLDLGNNHIRDTFPYWLGTLPRLKILILHFNKLYGAINVPESNSLFPSLHIIDLSHNEFAGLLPTKYFNAWSAMVDIDKENTEYWLTYDNYEISGMFFHNVLLYSMTIINKGLKMDYEKIIEIFLAIDLSCNKFEGEIPDVLGSLKGLRLLNLSNNILVGPIPPALENLKNLETLDLSQNKLTGSVPTQLMQLNFLEVFNISHNHLTGPIPKGQQFDTFDNSSFDGNSGLCGLPLSRKCDDSEASPSPSSTSKGNEDSELLAKFGWKTMALGYGCGFLVGVVIGNIVFARISEWLMRTYRIRLSRRRGKGSGGLNRIRMMQ